MGQPRLPTSAALSRGQFTRMRSSLYGMAHKASQLFDPGLFDGDENAIVDFSIRAIRG